MGVVTLVHRVAGIAAAIPLAITALTGSLLLARDPWYRHAFPALAAPVAASDPAQEGVVLTLIERRFSPETARVIKFPRTGFNAYHVYLSDGSEALVHPATGAVLDRWRWHERAVPFLFEMHAHLLAGEAGKTVTGAAGILALLLAISGVVTWWPRRRSLRLTRVWPGRLTTGALVRSHTAAGAVVAIPLLLFAATGAGIVFYSPIGAVVSAALDRTPPIEPAARVPLEDAAPQSWRHILTAAGSAFPGSRPAMVYPPAGDNAAVKFRFRLAGEWHPNGRSYVLVNPYDAAVLQAIDARDQGAGTRGMYALYPLHSAQVGQGVLTALGSITGVVTLWLAVSGVSSYLRRRRRSALAVSAALGRIEAGGQL